jgi:hypothetical protein
MSIFETMNMFDSILDLINSRRNYQECRAERESENDISQEETYVVKEDIRTEHPTVLTECPSLTACCFKRIEK